jgi:hypothetical protein
MNVKSIVLSLGVLGLVGAALAAETSKAKSYPLKT